MIRMRTERIFLNTCRPFDAKHAVRKAKHLPFETLDRALEAGQRSELPMAATVGRRKTHDMSWERSACIFITHSTMARLIESSLNAMYPHPLAPGFLMDAAPAKKSTSIRKRFARAIACASDWRGS
jgi:hypothetical protein